MKSNTKLLAAGLTLALYAAVTTGCSGPAKSANSAPQQALTEASDKPVRPIESRPPRIAGKVVETVNAGGYTYVELENNDGRFWAAVPATKVAIGEEVEIRPGMKMDNFTSKALNMTFETIIFSEGIVPKK